MSWVLEWVAKRGAECSAAAAICALASCALLTTVGGPAPGARPFEKRPVPGTGLSDWKGVFHCHSLLSHDSRGTIEEIAAAAEATGVDFVVMTDHESPHAVARGRHGFVNRTLFLVGGERRTAGGTVLAFPLKRYVRGGRALAEVAREVQAQGGLVFIGHAESFTDWDAPELDGVEIVNLHAAAKAASPAVLAIKGLVLPMIELLRELARRPSNVLSAWDHTLKEERRLVPIGGNDAHSNIELGIGTLGTYEEVFRTLTTHVLAERLDEEAIVEALRAGRTYVVFDLHRDGTGFDFRATKSGEVEALLGGEVARGHDVVLGVRTPYPAEIELWKDGAVAQREYGTTLALPDPEPGVYRVEALLPGRVAWILSGTITVRAGR
jgi:hypothetical protein